MIINTELFVIGGNGSDTPAPQLYITSDLTTLAGSSEQIMVGNIIVREQGELPKQVVAQLGLVSGIAQKAALPCPCYCNNEHEFVIAATDAQILALLNS